MIMNDSLRHSSKITSTNHANITSSVIFPLIMSKYYINDILTLLKYIVMINHSWDWTKRLQLFQFSSRINYSIWVLHKHVVSSKCLMSCLDHQLSNTFSDDIGHSNVLTMYEVSCNVVLRLTMDLILGLETIKTIFRLWLPIICSSWWEHVTLTKVHGQCMIIW